MNTLIEIQNLKHELSQWFAWVVSEEDVLNRSTDDYTKELLKVRLTSGYRLLAACEAELTAVTNAYEAALADIADGVGL